MVARDRSHDEIATLLERDLASHNVNTMLPIYEAVLASNKDTVV